MIYPSNFEEKTDFLSIRSILKEKCISALGREKVDDIAFQDDFELIVKLLDQTEEMHRLMHLPDEQVPLSDFTDVRQGISRIRVEGLFLDEGELNNLRKALSAVIVLVNFIQKQEESRFPELISLSSDIQILPQIVKQIDQILDKFGKVKDNASGELAKIRREMTRVQNTVSRTLMAILRQAQADGFVEKDAQPSFREGRLVIPVTPAFKRKVSGIVHDESATGKTLYIEPTQVVEANNMIRELEGEERREIIRILKEFTDFVRPYAEDIINSQAFLGEMDFLQAKAVFGDEIQAIRPKLDDVCQLEWKRARHPLLYLNLLKQKKEVVPLDIELNESQRILIISGPNAGGKSVCLKTVVLLQYMLQCGLLIPVHEDSRCGLFKDLFIDIGDEQSIENDLSTYSSHLLNMKNFIRNAGASSLLLIDEFGTGTEPMIGGAIAEAALERFNRNKSFGVITTHYTNLKHYAEDAEGVVNGAMLYDRQHLQPLFQLQIGNPGSSFAVEIARKIGLPEDLIKDAADKVGAEHLDYDKHLQDIVRDKRYWENKRQQVRIKEKKMDELLAKYEAKIASLDLTRKELGKQAKSEAAKLLSEANAKIENTIREIRENQAEKEKTKKIRAELSDFRQKLEASELESSAKPKLKLKKKTESDVLSKGTERPHAVGTVGTAGTAGTAELKLNDSVRMQGQTAVGVLMEIQGKQALVAFGQLKSKVKLSQLEKVSKNQMKKEGLEKYQDLGKKTSDEVRQRKLHFKSDIDVRGMRADEALQAVTYFIDDALMIGVSAVKILHGTGTGALRQLIRQYLGTVHGVLRCRDEHIQLGGAGITIVEFED